MSQKYELIRAQKPEEAFAQLFLEELKKAVERRGLAVAALTGGQTATRCYTKLAKLPLKERLVLRFTVFFQTDERCVPPQHEASNQRMISLALIERIRPVAGFFPMPSDPEGIEDHERRLEEFLPFDVVHLGMGPDGHFASIFPDPLVFKEGGRGLLCFCQDRTGVNPYRRISLTYKALKDAGLVVFTVSGKERAGSLAKALRSENPLLSGLEVERIVFIADEEALSEYDGT